MENGAFDFCADAHLRNVMNSGPRLVLMAADYNSIRCHKIKLLLLYLVSAKQFSMRNTFSGAFLFLGLTLNPKAVDQTSFDSVAVPFEMMNILTSLMTVNSKHKCVLTYHYCTLCVCVCDCYRTSFGSWLLSFTLRFSQCCAVYSS